MQSLTNVYTISDNRLDLFYFRQQLCTPNSSIQTYDEYLKIFRVVSGRGTWVVESRSYDLAPGDILIMNNTERRMRKDLEEDEPLVLEYIQFLPILLYPNQQCAVSFFYRPANFENRICRESPNFSIISSLFSRIREECESENLYKRECVYGLLLQILVMIGREYGVDEHSEETGKYCNLKNYKIISDAVRYITQYPYEDLSVETLAKKYYVSKFYFSHLFKFYNGMNLSSYVKRCRVNYAVELIRSGNAGIADAAFSSGFGCISGFYKAVKDVTGLTPGEFLHQGGINTP